MRARISCIEANASSVALASGKCVALISSADFHDGVFERSGDDFETASRRRTTIRAANISPVPEKKQGSDGTDSWNILDFPSLVEVDPMTLSCFGSVESESMPVVSDDGNETDVITT